MGCDDGTVWICVDFEVQTSIRFSDVGHPITDLRKLPPMRDLSGKQFVLRISLDVGRVIFSRLPGFIPNSSVTNLSVAGNLVVACLLTNKMLLLIKKCVFH